MPRFRMLAVVAAAAAALTVAWPAGAQVPVVDEVTDRVEERLDPGRPAPPTTTPAASPAPAPAPPAAAPAPAQVPAPAPRASRPTAASGPAPAPPSGVVTTDVVRATEIVTAPLAAVGTVQPEAAVGPASRMARALLPEPLEGRPPTLVIGLAALLLGAVAAVAGEGLANKWKSSRYRVVRAAGDHGFVAGASHRSRNLQATGMFALALTGIALITHWSNGAVGHYGLIAVGYLGVKLVLSARYRPHAGGPELEGLTVAAIVPFYNEDPAAFERCLRSLLDQTRRPDEIWVIDDGSPERRCLGVARAVLAGVPGVRIHAFRRNQGKRHAQAWAFERSQADLFCTIDSDTVLDPHALSEGVKPFADDRIQAVTGNVRALNHRSNLLTKLIDLRYANAFLYERAAYSMLGSVLCACGSLSFWRAEVIKDNLEDFVTQTFLGIPVQYGDDRRLTNYALQRGRVVVQDSSIAYTVVPERMNHFVRQQLRWNKSFFRETLWVLRNFTARAWVWWLSLAEIVLWATFSFGIVATTVVRPVLTGKFALLYYLSYMGVMAYARSVRYFGAMEASGWYQLYVFLLSPVYAAMHVLLLIPLRVWALFTLRQRGWGTRATGVEVGITATTTAPEAPSTPAIAA